MNAHIFIDADNIKPEVGFQAIENFSRKYFISGVEIIGNELNLSSKYLEAGDRYNIKNCFYGKNSADTWLCTEIAKTIFQNPELDAVIIISSDRDFLAAIKLVTDQNKKVILVSDGNGHKNLKALLFDLKINPALVELIDFKNDLAAESKKPAVKISAEKISPAPASPVNVKETFKDLLPPNLQSFLEKNENKVKIISIMHAEIFTDVPFIDGMNISTFTNILVAMHVAYDGKIVKKIISENPLRSAYQKVFFDANKKLPPPKNPFETVFKYLDAHAAEMQNISLKFGENSFEVPFVDGINFSTFTNILLALKVIPDGKSFEKILAENPLKLENNQLFFDAENFQILKYLEEHADQVQNISLKFGENSFEVPFVDGMDFSAFKKILLTMEIIPDEISFEKILAENPLKLENNQIFFDAENFQILKYLEEHADQVQNISLKFGENSFEVPFVDGMDFSVFKKILLTMEIIPDENYFEKILAENPLKLKDDKIFINVKNPFDDVIDYFLEHAAETKNIFIKCNGKLYEVPFVNGISLETFSELLKAYEIAKGEEIIKKIIADSYLKLRDDEIYFNSEDNISADLEPYLNKIPPPVLEYFRKHERQLIFVKIAYNNAVYKLPFVEGMNISTFAYMLRSLKILGKNASSIKVLAANGFTVKDNSIFKLKRGQII